MPVIYEPKGPAKEYAPLAINLYHGCRFACRYCYVPAIARKHPADWSANPKPKASILKRLRRDAQRMAGDPRTILLCFTCDPYQSPEAAILTRKALLILEKYGMTVTILTKAGLGARQDFDILERNGWQFGTTLSCYDPTVQEKWEPNAATPHSRGLAMNLAHDIGIKTWVSMEPVYDTESALDAIQMYDKDVDFWKIGKMNHRKIDIDWPKFRKDAVALLDSLGAKYYIKKELREV